MQWKRWRLKSEKKSDLIIRPSHLVLGEMGEQLAAEHLKGNGYQIVLTNLVVPIGYSLSGRQIHGEIDIVAYDQTMTPFTLAFIEVKTRTKSDIATPEAAVNAQKQRRIVRAAKVYRRLLRIEKELYRYDVISIIASGDGPPECTLLRNYFTEQRFTQSSWYAQKF